MRYFKDFAGKISLALCAVLLFAVFCPVEASAATGNFNKKKTVVIAQEDDFSHTQEYTWIKYKAPNHGYITVTAQKKGASGAASGLFSLYDAKKKTPLSGDYAYNTAGPAASYTVVYGVKKKTTYYLRVAAEGAVSVKCKFTKTSKSYANKKANAQNLAKGKLAKGIMAAGDNTADWYKVTVPKKQYLNFYFSGKASGKIQLTFSGSYLNTAKRYVVQGDEAENRAYTIERVQPGNYYVKVERADSVSSGFYTLKWY